MVDLSSIGTSLGGFKSGVVGLSAYAWVLWIFIPIALIIFVAFIWKTFHDMKKQWTHILKIRRVGSNNLLGKEQIIKMKRFPLIKRAEVFELQKPVLGGYLMPELDSYTGTNEFAIIIDTNNRIYTNTGEYFNPDKSCVSVSAKHSEIDISRADLRADYQNVNKTNKTVEWAKIAGFALAGIFIIALMIVFIKGFEQWGANNKEQTIKAQAEAEAMTQMVEMMKTTEGTLNTQVLILDLLKELYKTNNIQGIIREKTNATIS